MSYPSDLAVKITAAFEREWGGCVPWPATQRQMVAFTVQRVLDDDNHRTKVSANQVLTDSALAFIASRAAVAGSGIAGKQYVCPRCHFPGNPSVLSIQGICTSCSNIERYSQ